MNINIVDPAVATAAAEWCASNNVEYKLEFWGWPGSTVYKFLFEKELDMIVFSLKWAR